MKARFWILLICSLAALYATLARAQGEPGKQFELTGFTIGSGGTSTGLLSTGVADHDHRYTLSDAIGQPIVETQSSETYTLTNGFQSGLTTVDTLLLLYFNGDNDLWEYVLEAAQQAQAGATITKTVTVVQMLLDGPKAEDTYLYRLDHKGATQCNFYEDFTCGGRYVLGYNVEKYSDNLGDKGTLTTFIADSVSRYPSARKIVLSMVGHGGGWAPNVLAGQPRGHPGQPGLGGLVWDNNGGGTQSGTSLSTVELSTALQEAQQITHRSIDLLYLDACLMGMWEVAYQIRNQVHYLLASESWTWTAFAYDKLLQELNESASTIDFGKRWIEHKRATLAQFGYPYTYALIDLSQMEPLSQAVHALGSAMSNLLPIESTNIYSAFVASDCFDSDADSALDRGSATEDGDTYCDLLSFSNEITKTLNAYPEVVSAAQAVATSVRAAVKVNVQGNGFLPGQYGSYYWSWKPLGGISIYLPLNEKDDWKRKYYNTSELESSLGKNGWDEFLNKYRTNPDNVSSASCADPCPLPRGPMVVNPHQIFLPVIQR